MFKYWYVPARLMVICLMLAACGGSVPTSEGKTVVITPAIQGNSASMNVGDRLKIQIPTIPTEGFEWIALDLDESILVQEGSAVYAEDTNPDSAGGIVTLFYLKRLELDRQTSTCCMSTQHHLYPLIHLGWRSK
jgi:hypothetical protein